MVTVRMTIMVTAAAAAIESIVEYPLPSFHVSMSLLHPPINIGHNRSIERVKGDGVYFGVFAAVKCGYVCTNVFHFFAFTPWFCTPI